MCQNLRFNSTDNSRDNTTNNLAPNSGLSKEDQNIMAASKKVIDQAFQDIVKPINAEDIYEPAAKSLSEEYKHVFNHFSKPSVSQILPENFRFMTPDQREACMTHIKAYEDARLKIAEKYGFSMVPGDGRLCAVRERANTTMNPTPIKVCVTGASGQLGYALVFRIASGGLFGPNQPVIMSLLEVEAALPSLQGVVMELKDCAFPVLADVTATATPEKAFEGCDYALLVGAFPRGPGMERKDLLTKNAEIFSVQGKALNNSAKGAATRVVVVGNPANTNALIASHYAPNIPVKNFSALTRLDHNRGLAQLAEKAKCGISDISRFVIWGNHSSTMVPDITHASIKGQLATDVITDTEWLRNTFTPSVQKRGAAIIAARKLSSAASAANAVVDATASWHFGTHSEWTSAAHYSDGQYGVTQGIFYSYPIVYNESRNWEVVRNLPIDQYTADLMEATHKELLEERDGVAHLLK